MNGDENLRPTLSKKQRKKMQQQKFRTQNPKESGNKQQGQQSGSKKRVKPKSLRLIPDDILQGLPVPAPEHLAVLSKFLNTVSTEYGMSKTDLALRWQVFNDVRDLFEQEIKGCTLRMYGSSKSCFGLRTSDINIDVNEENEEKIPEIFIVFLNVLKGCKKYCQIKEEFESKWPVINFKDINSGLTCRVSTGNNFAFLTNSLLKIYGQLDSRVKPLCHGFRLWAKICEVDRQAAGTLPPYSFFLMVIHYLQQIEPPVLPVIHDKFGGVLTNCLEKEDSSLLADVRKDWKTRNKSSLGELWLGLFRFYCNYEKNETFVVNIRQKKRMTRTEKVWGKKKIAIEDPFSTKRNVARTLLKTQAYQYTIEHLKVALVYFSRHPDSPITDIQLKENKSNVPDQHSGGRNIQPSDEPHREVRPEEDAEAASSESDEDEQGNDEIDDDDEIDDENGTAGDENHKSDIEELTDGIFAMDPINDSVISDDDCADTTATDQSLLNDSTCPHEVAENESLGPTVSPKVSSDTNKCGTASSELPVVDWKKAEYLFDHSVLRKGDALETKCTYCGDEDHIVDFCTAEQVTRTLKPLPNVPDWFKDILTKVCYCCRDDFAITKEEVEKRHFYLKALEAYITKFMRDARLHLFGSSVSGFGFTQSDIDLCMTLEGKAKNDVDCIEMITWLAGILRKNPECAEVIPITGAKVPIVKFFLRHAKVEADISMYNEVALWNTKLLAAYVHIDQRVHILGSTLKIFVKLCDIGDASRGSLSSYAYILMLLHFLQQRQPPVLPVLQELYHTAEQPQNIVEGHNCWFYSDLKKLGSEWTARNTESCGELWLGFLRYYTEEFDYRRNVVCVRFLKPLTKFEKLWNGRQICIEDPFVLSHNLGAALTLGMVKFIRSTFEKARERFGTARRDIPADAQERQRFFFDTYFLNDGHLPPTGRNCNVCGKIGHWAKECPFKSRRGRGKSEKNQQNQAGKNQQNKKEEDRQKTTENGEQNKDEKFSKNVAGKNPQNNAAKTPPGNIVKTPENNAGKTPQTNSGRTPQSNAVKSLQNNSGKPPQNNPGKPPQNNSGKTPQNMSENDQRAGNAERNQEKEVGKPLQKKEEQREKLEKNAIEGTAKVVQNSFAADAVAVKWNTPDHQRTAHPVQPQQTMLTGPLPKRGQFSQPQRPVSIQANSPSIAWPYQPLSPPISPGNPMATIPSMQPPSPMSNQPRHEHMLPRTPLAYQQHGMVLGNTAPGSLPVQHSSPIRTPIRPLISQRPSHPFNMSYPPMFSEVSPRPGIPRTPPQTRAAPMSPVRIPISPLMRPPSFNPMTMNNRPIFSESPQMGTVPMTPPQCGAPPMSPVRTPISPLMRPPPFNPMSINNPPMFSESPQMGTVPMTPPQSGAPHMPQYFGGPGNPFAFNFFPRDHNMFLNNSRPLYQPLGSPAQPLLSPQHGPMNSGPVIRQDILNRVTRIISCQDLERGDGHESDHTDGVPKTPVSDTSSSGKVPNADFSPWVLASLRALNVNDLDASAQTGAQDQNAGSKQQETTCEISAAGMVGKGEGISYGIENASQDFKHPPSVQNVADVPPSPKERDAVAVQGEGFVFNAEHSEVTTSQISKNKQRKNRRRKEEQIQGVKDSENFTANIPPFKDALEALSLQAQQLQLESENVAIEQGKPEGKPDTSSHSKVLPQHTHRQQPNDKQEETKKNPNRQADPKKHLSALQHAQNDLQQLQESKREQKQQHYTRQPKPMKSPTNKEKSNQEFQQQNLKQEQTQPRHRKPREVKRQYRNQRQPPFNSPPKQSHPFASRQHFSDPQQALQQMPTQTQHQQDVQQTNKVSQQGASQHIKSPKGRQWRQDQNVCNEKTPTKDAVGQLVVKVKGDQREVSAQGSQDVNNTNQNSRKRTRRRKPKNRGIRDDS